MSTPAEFPAKLAEIQRAMEREEWTKAIHDLENIGPIPDKLQAVASNILFFLYVSRNQFEKLVPLCEKFETTRSKDSIAALLLLRDKVLEYPVKLPAGWTVSAWEQAIEAHAIAGKLEPKEVLLCLYFLSLLNCPRLLEKLHLLAVEAGAELNDDTVEAILSCYLKNQWFSQARRFLWVHNLNNIAFKRFDFLIDRAEKARVDFPESTDKFLCFLRAKFGAQLPAKAPDFASSP